MTHPELVSNLVKLGCDIVADLTPQRAHLLHMAVGVSGESGELLDCVKKHAIYCKPLDTENLKEEMGDIEFFLEGIRQATGITRDECLSYNINKLTTRYGSGSYSNYQANTRADKQ